MPGKNPQPKRDPRVDSVKTPEEVDYQRLPQLVEEPDDVLKKQIARLQAKARAKRNKR
jgi:hypothetical protein